MKIGEKWKGGRRQQVFYNQALGVESIVRIFAFILATVPPMPANRVFEDIFDLIGKSEEIEQASLAMKAIAHPLRLKVLCVLAGGEMPVQDIMEAVGTTQSNVSQHLAILRDKKILKTRKEANRVHYRIADERTVKLVGMMREVFCGLPPRE